jgi:hypothetical protein
MPPEIYPSILAKNHPGTVEAEENARIDQLKSIGGRPLMVSGIYRILHNQFYYGVIRFIGEFYPGKHEPMITKNRF